MTAKDSVTSWIPLIVLCLAQFLASADNITLSIATRTLMVDLHATLSQVGTANTLYPLIAGTFMVAGGMLGCIWGWLRLFRLGCGLFILAETCAVFSPSIQIFSWSARILAGVGGSMMIPAVFGLITSLYQGQQRATAFGALGAASGISFACGPILCGYLLDNAGWRMAFTSLGGLAVLILLCSLLIPAYRKPRTMMPFDIVGFILATLGLFLTIFGILNIPVWGLIHPLSPPFTFFGLSPALLVLLSGISILAGMLRWERRYEKITDSALIPGVFLRTTQVRFGLYLTAWIFFAYSAGIFTVVSFVQIIRGFSATETGLLILPFALCMSACSLGLPLLIKNRNALRQCQGGLLSGIAGTLIAASGLREMGISLSLVVCGLALIGAGMGTLSANAPSLVTSGTGTKHAEQSGGVQAAARDVGQAIGIALVSTIMMTFLTFSMKYHVLHDVSIDQHVRQIIQHINTIAWGNDTAFLQLFRDIPLSKIDGQKLMALYQHTRMQGARLGLLAMALITLILLVVIRKTSLKS